MGRLGNRDGTDKYTYNYRFDYLGTEVLKLPAMDRWQFLRHASRHNSIPHTTTLPPKQPLPRHGTAPSHQGIFNIQPPIIPRCSLSGSYTVPTATARTEFSMPSHVPSYPAYILQTNLFSFPICTGTAPGTAIDTSNFSPVLHIPSHRSRYVRHSFCLVVCPQEKQFWIAALTSDRIPIATYADHPIPKYLGTLDMTPHHPRTVQFRNTIHRSVGQYL